MHPKRLLPRAYIPQELRSKTRLHLLVIVFTVLGATLLFSWFESYPLLDSFYFVVLVMTLIGASYTPVTVAGQMLAIVVAFISVGVILSFLTQVLGPATLANYWESRKAKKVSTMKDHIVICGFSDTARALVRSLPKETILVVVKEKETAEHLQALGVPTLHGDYESTEILRRAGVAESRAVVAVSPEDSENAFICLTAKKLAPNVPVIATVTSEENLEKLKDVKADHIISPALLSAASIREALGGP